MSLNAALEALRALGKAQGTVFVGVVLLVPEIFWG
jgi:hypothetical protein